MIPVFLVYKGPAGDTAHVLLPRAEPSSQVFLCNTCDQGIDFAIFKNSSHSTVRIQTFSDYLLLSAWDEQNGAVSVTTRLETVKIPLSSPSEVKSFILLDGYEFITPSGRWAVEFDYDNSISNSMRPPPLPDLSGEPDSPYNDALEEHEKGRAAAGNDSGFVEGLGEDDEALEKCDIGLAVIETVDTNHEALIEVQAPNVSAQYGLDLADAKESPSTPLATATTTSKYEHRKHSGSSFPSHELSRGDQREASAEFQAISGLQSADNFREEVQEDAEHFASTGSETELDEHATTGVDVITNNEMPQDCSLTVADVVIEERIPPSCKRLAGGESPVIPEAGFARSCRQFGEESQVIPEVISTPHRRRSGQESQAIPTPKKSANDQRQALQGEHTYDPAQAEHCTPSRPTTEPKGVQREKTWNEYDVQSAASNPGPVRSPTAIRSSTPTQSRSMSRTNVPPLLRPGKRKRCDPALTPASAEGSDTDQDNNMATRTTSSSGQKMHMSKVAEQGQQADTIILNVPSVTRQSKRSRRASSSDTIEDLVPLPANPRVVFSKSCNIQNKNKTMATFTELGGIVVNDIDAADVLCVSNGQLKRTPKFILALVLGKAIVTENWIVESQRRRWFPDISLYMPKDAKREKEWRFSLRDAVSRNRGAHGRQLKLLEDWLVYITLALQKDLSNLLDEYEKIAKAMGARQVRRRLPTGKAQGKKILVLGDKDDADIIALSKLGHRLHNKHILTMAALRGQLEVDSEEFEIEIPVKEEEASQT